MSGILRHFHLTGVLGLVLAAAGCSDTGEGPALYRVTGEASYNGTPIENGRILFRNKGGDGRAYSAEIKNGRYDLKCESGTMRVEITASRIIPGKYSTANPGEKEPVGEMYIPAKYNSKTTLEAKVEQKSNEIPFQLSK